VHRRAAHVVGFSYTDDSDVRDVGPDKGIMGRIRRGRREGLRRDGGKDERHQENTGQQSIPDSGDLFGTILHISRWTYHDLIFSAKAVLPSDYSDNTTGQAGTRDNERNKQISTDECKHRILGAIHWFTLDEV
jgi:hypothetical protein